MTSRFLRRIGVVTARVGARDERDGAAGAGRARYGAWRSEGRRPTSRSRACDAAAKAALTAVVNDASEIGTTSEWVGLAPATGPDGTVATAAIHCFPLGSNGYVVTFTCATQVPPNPDSASALCGKLSAAFEGK